MIMTEIVSLLTSNLILSVIAVFGSGYLALVWGYRRMGKLDYFLTKFNEFDKFIQALLLGTMIIIVGAFIDPIFSKLAIEELTWGNFLKVAIIELPLIFIIGQLFVITIRTLEKI